MRLELGIMNWSVMKKFDWSPIMTQDCLAQIYDNKTVRYLLANNLHSFKNHCNCGGAAKTPIRHQSYCNQEQEVLDFYR
jgi:hypothetical protein